MKTRIVAVDALTKSDRRSVGLYEFPAFMCVFCVGGWVGWYDNGTRRELCVMAPKPSGTHVTESNADVHTIEINECILVYRFNRLAYSYPIAPALMRIT